MDNLYKILQKLKLSCQHYAHCFRKQVHQLYCVLVIKQALQLLQCSQTAHRYLYLTLIVEITVECLAQMVLL